MRSAGDGFFCGRRVSARCDIAHALHHAIDLRNVINVRDEVDGAIIELCISDTGEQNAVLLCIPLKFVHVLGADAENFQFLALAQQMRHAGFPHQLFAVAGKGK